MLKSFGHQATRWHRGFLIMFAMVPAFVALLVPSSFVVFPSTSTAAVQPEADGNIKCDCSNLKALQAELFNALLLQQAFRNKIPELRTMNLGTSTDALKQFAEGEARRGLKEVPDYKGPNAFDYVSWGDARTDPDYLPADKTDADLCAFSEDAGKLFNRAKQASGCAGIAAALEAHEQVHISTCNRIHYRPYLTMHRADRAQEEVEAYGAQIKVLREVLASLHCGYSASGKEGDTVFSGVICDLEKPFTLTTNNPFMPLFEFVPSSSTGGTWRYSYTNGVSGEGMGQYTLEGSGPQKTGILLKGTGTATAPIAGSGSGAMHIDLVPSNECGSK
ncbi:MAG: hypothetical protein M3R69_05790 [Acidobacteriota bacterium]|nr:hypothetical protein [Acidobacteriota bacterium]